jgi:hypothetical protein
MTNSLRAYFSKGLVVSMLTLLLFTATPGCGQQRPERTQDPEEIERLRQEHLKQAEREMQETR